MNNLNEYENSEVKQLFFLIYIFLFLANFIVIIKMIEYISKLNYSCENVLQIPRQKTKIDYKNKLENVLEDHEKSAIYNENVSDSENAEAAWKRRVLMEFVEGHGNIIMVYDYYRRGFCYYSDLSSIPYNILVDIAYKYALTYKCISYLRPPPEEDNASVAKEPAKKTSTYQVNSFEAKLRGGGAAPVEENQIALEKKKECVKIIRIGKICDFSFLTKAATISEKIAAKSISYKDFISQQRR